jgi:hypothetical protein
MPHACMVWEAPRTEASAAPSVNAIARRVKLAESAASPRQAAAATKAPGYAAAAAPAAAAPANATASAASNPAASNAAASAARETVSTPSEAAATASAATSAAAVSAAAAASERDLHARPGGSRGFIVEEIEGSQADPGDVLLVEHGDLERRRILPEHIGYRPEGRRCERSRRYIRRRSAGRRGQ